MSGEQITYAYDALNRLISGVTSDNPNVTQWGQGFTYDGFGNLTGKSVTKGTAPYLSVGVDAATNRIVGYQYDANGNQTWSNTQTLSYDYDNRMVNADNWNYTGSQYGYDPDNKRVYTADWTYDYNTSLTTVSNEVVYFFGVTGQRMAAYTLVAYASPPTVSLTRSNDRVYFGGKLIRGDSGQWADPDRLGSVGTYFPYGENRNGGGGMFATYTRDASGLDYADQRYYWSNLGRFTSPDPYGDNWNSADPASWNMYAYVNGDPVNLNDPDGLTCSNVLLEGWAGIPAGTKVGDFLSKNSDLSIFAKTVFTESRIGSDDLAAYEKAAISAVIMNRWQIVDGNYDLYTGQVGRRGSSLARTSPDWGKADGTTGSVVHAAGQFAVWSSPGYLDSDAQKRLNAALNSNEISDQCQSLLQSIGTVAGFWSARNDHTMYASVDNVIFTSFGSGAGAANKSYYETTIGSFGSPNVFYGVSQSQIWRHGVPVPPRPRRPRAVAGLE